MNPLVSVMLCTNQLDQYFQQALASILSQTLEQIEIVLVFNGADDQLFDTFVSTCEDTRVRAFRSRLQGVTFSRNLALQEARASLVAVMDADDIARSGRLAEQYRFMQANPDVIVCGGNYETIDETGCVMGKSTLPQDNHAIRRALVWSNPLCHPATMFRRDAALAVGGYSGTLAEDYEFWLKLLSLPDSKFHNLPAVLLGYRTPVLSKARRSRQAYAQVASAQFRQGVLTKSPRWLLASLVSAGKTWFRARQA